MAESPLEHQFEIGATVEFIRRHGFSRVALQFPDELLKQSVEIVDALEKYCDDDSRTRFFVMADTTFGSCCVDEVAAAHVNADCIVHYGRACLSPVSRLPVWFVFGKSPLRVDHCSKAVAELAASSELLVLYDLDYAYAIPELREAVKVQRSRAMFAEVVSKEMSPSIEPVTRPEDQHEIAGLRWESANMDECKILWIGVEGPALTSVMLTYNLSTTVRYDPETGSLHELSNQSGALMRRYYLVERAKDANIVGIVVGTLGVAGYNEAIQRIKKSVKEAGKKAYTLAVGKPNPAKLANFPECDVFVLVACSQTALVDSKQFLAPLITTFEAELAFGRGSQWTGSSYCLDFRKAQLQSNSDAPPTTPHFSFIKGGYVTSGFITESEEEEDDGAVAGNSLVKSSPSSSSALSLQDPRSAHLKLASEFFQTRTFQGLPLDSTTKSSNLAAAAGQKGRAAVYDRERVS